MPQMAPLWWEILFLMFIITFMVMNIIMYFSFKLMIKKNLNSVNKITQLNWLW